ncbi:protein-disulfide reductase DsbD family protein [Pseudomonadota bacterium]
MRKILSLLSLIAAVVLPTVLLGANATYAAATDWAATDNTRLRVISQTQAVGTDAQVTLGLHFELNDHWKIYWRTPGDAGYPPSVVSEGSTNVAETRIEWPLPERFSILGFETLGYTDEAVLPLVVTLDTPGEAMTLKAQISYLACAEICIPYDEELTFTLPAGPADPSAEAHLINRFQVQVPQAGPAQGLSLDRVEFKADGPKAGTGTLYISVTSEAPFTNPDVYVEGPDVIAFAKPRVSFSSDQNIAILEIPFEGLKYLKTPFENAVLTLTVADAPRSAEFSGAVASPASADMLALVDDMERPMPAGPPLLAMLGLALLGGVILNLMPCVLPVLSIKLLGVVGHGGGQTRTVRMSFLASSAGIIASFWVLAAALLVLKSAGLAIGWGIQFQHPWFLVAMAMVVTLFACNLWGFFEVHLPESVAEIGAQEVHVHGLGGHFMTGALATLLATPCSAPFLGTAVGFALARGTDEILAIFTALGIGLALPYLLIAAYPKFATMMPKPGPWMVILRRILGFALAGTGVWLVSILAVQISQIAATAIGGIMVVVALTLYIHKRLHRRFGRLDWGAVAILAALAFAVPDNVGNGPDNAPVDAKLEGLWMRFDERTIKDLVAEGKVVFVDVTAKWCITCQVNKAVVVGQGEVLARLQTPDTVAMQADWTKPSDAISRYLASFGRYGIPFNAVYGPGAPDGIALPELLSEKVVIEALDKAAKTHP